MTRARVARVIVAPGLILLVVWGFSVMQRQRDARNVAIMERAVSAWCQAAARGEDPRMRSAIKIPQARVVEALRSACRKGDRPTAWSIAIAEGPGAAPSGRAAHHAMIRVDGVDDLGLLLAVEDGQALVIGYWLVP